jgi:radical SAM superfamily enzyme YgiQ (UPF0313 family)
MHPPGSVLLVSCYELGHQPLGLVVPAGVLERAGIAASVIDLALDTLHEETAISAKLIGISVPMHTALRLGVRVAQRVRQINPSAHICFYGVYAGLNEAFLREHGADTCLGGEFEAGLVALARRVLAAPRGVAPRDVVFDAAVPSSATRGLDLTPSRSRLRRHRGYVQVDDGDALRSVGAVLTTRGCKHECRHCPLTPAYEGRFYAIPADDVLADVGALVESGVSHITFADPDFLNGPGHARRIARRLHERFPRVTFDYTAKVEHLLRHSDLVEELCDLGSLFVVSAVESFNDDVLHHLDKGHTRADAIVVVRHFRDMGLTLRPSLVPFTPWETLDSYIDLLDTVAAEGLVAQIDPVQYSIRLLVPPGSRLLDGPAMDPHLEGLDAPRFTYRWRHPDPRMDRLQERIARIVERAAETGTDPFDTFTAVREEAHRTRSGEIPEGVTKPPKPRRRAPRLTEAWFC